jgi:hypothetical protein
MPLLRRENIAWEMGPAFIHVPIVQYRFIPK